MPWWPGSLHVRDYRPREKLEHYPRYHVRIRGWANLPGHLKEAIMLVAGTASGTHA